MITYDSITKVYNTDKGPLTVLKDVSFTVPKGETVVFLGPSGCGKTTLLRMTNRLESITLGNILINGDNINDYNPVKLRQSIGYVIQRIGLFPNKTMADNVATVPKLLGHNKKEIEKRVDELLEMVQLPPRIYANRYPCELSGGQQQRIGVARALASDPEILLMDEPFGAIDPINREGIQNEFLKIQSSLKKTIVFVSHDIHEAIKMGDRIALFNKGNLVQYDTPEMILTRPKNKFVADFVGADRALKVLGLMKVKEIYNRTPKNVVKDDDEAEEVLKQMEIKKHNYCIVIKNDKPIGYVTPKTLKYESGKVGNLVEAFPLFVGLNNTLKYALSSMLMHDVISVCVVDDHGTFEGVLTYKNIQEAIKNIYMDDSEDD